MSSKRRAVSEVHSVKTQKVILFIVTSVRARKLAVVALLTCSSVFYNGFDFLRGSPSTWIRRLSFSVLRNSLFALSFLRIIEAAQSV
jgi:hypothetical protein